jgi:O-antigen ligase
MFVFYGTSIFDSIKRPGEKSGESFSRMDIWAEALGVITQDLRIFFGYGINGFENNILKSTKVIFGDQHLQTAHNFIFQNIIDFGFFGIIIILFVIYKILRKVIQLNSYILTILLVMILLMGTTESIPSFYSFEPTLFFMAIVAIIITNNERKSNQLS